MEDRHWSTSCPCGSRRAARVGRPAPADRHLPGQRGAPPVPGGRTGSGRDGTTTSSCRDWTAAIPPAATRWLRSSDPPRHETEPAVAPRLRPAARHADARLPPRRRPPRSTSGPRSPLSSAVGSATAALADDAHVPGSASRAGPTGRARSARAFAIEVVGPEEVLAGDPEPAATTGAASPLRRGDARPHRLRPAVPDRLATPRSAVDSPSPSTMGV